MTKIAITTNDEDDQQPTASQMAAWAEEEYAEATEDKMLEDEEPKTLFGESMD